MFIAVYGSLRKGYWNHPRLMGALYKGTYKTKEKYLMTAYSYPFVYKDMFNEYADDMEQVTVEIYKLTNEKQILSCDSLEGHPVMYRREPVEIEGFGNAEVQMYFYQNGITGSHIITTGDYADYYKPSYEDILNYEED